MNIILLESQEASSPQVILTDHRAEHIVKVLRSSPGDQLRVGEIDGKMGFGLVESLKTKYPFEVRLRVTLQELPPPVVPIDLILALPRPIMLRRILSQATALGIGNLHLIGANRVEKSFWKATILEPNEYRMHLLHGLEQAVDTRLPNIHLHRRFKPFIEDYFPRVAKKYSSRICAHLRGNNIAEIEATESGKTVVAIGPEGGWVDFEVEKFEEQGFVCCTIGKRILKVDTAVVALHATITTLRSMKVMFPES